MGAFIDFINDRAVAAVSILVFILLAVLVLPLAIIAPNYLQRIITKLK